jgi:hypothetical protein
LQLEVPNRTGIADWLKMNVLEHLRAVVPRAVQEHITEK